MALFSKDLTLMGINNGASWSGPDIDVDLKDFSQ